MFFISFMISIKERKLIVRLHQQGKNQQEIADLIDCSQPTAHKWITRFKRGKTLDILPRSGRPTKLTKQNLAKLKNKILVLFSRVLEIKPNLSEVINCRGRAYRHSQRLELSLQDHTKAIEINPLFGEAYRNRGNDYYCLGNFDIMMIDFDRAVELMPLSALAFNNRGFALQHFACYQEAIMDHSRAIELDQTYTEAYSDRAKALRAIGQNDLAGSDEEKAKRL